MASKFQSQVIKHYEKNGWTVLNIIKLSDNGYPDLLCMKFGEVDTWIECKEGGDTLKPLQKHRLNQLIAQGFDAKCIHETKGVIYPI
jgi:hypothetical protein